jgi:hypothetical protein
MRLQFVAGAPQLLHFSPHSVDAIFGIDHSSPRARYNLRLLRTNFVLVPHSGQMTACASLPLRKTSTRATPVLA